jgi:hypothetical protein
MTFLLFEPDHCRPVPSTDFIRCGVADFVEIIMAMMAIIVSFAFLVVFFQRWP